MRRERSSTAIALLVLSLLCSKVSLAQSGGCTEPEFRAFDFWLGKWDVTDNATGNVAGKNSITQLEAGCMLLESWAGAGGGTGTSVNYYNPVEKKWRQLWISAGRYSIDISGGLEGQAMRLEGSIYPFAGAAARFRGTWTPNADGSVGQFFEQYDEDSQAWTVWFDGRYVRSED